VERLVPGVERRGRHKFIRAIRRMCCPGNEEGQAWFGLGLAAMSLVIQRHQACPPSTATSPQSVGEIPN
jgi:hypothetical protein